MSMDLINLAVILAAVVNLGLGMFVYARGAKNLINIFYSLVAASVSLWCLSMILYRMTPDPEAALLWSRILYLAPVCIVTSFLLFTFVFPAGRYPLSHAQTFLLLLPAALTAAMIMMPQVTVRHIFSPASGEKFIVFGPGYAFYFCFIISYFGWGFFRLGRNYFLSTGIKKMQIRYVFFGTFLSANLGMVTNLILPTLGVFSFNWLGQVLSIIMVSFIAYAVIRHRLMDIRLILKRTIIYSVLLVMSLSFYAALILLSHNFFENTLGSTVSIILGALLMALGFEPLRKLFQRVTERVFFKSEYDPEDVLSRVSRVLSSIVDLKRIMSTVNEILVSEIRMKQMSTLLLEEERGRLVLQSKVGDGDLEYYLPSAPEEDPLREYYLEELGSRETLNFYELRRELDEAQANPRKERLADHLETLGVILVVPIVSKDRLIGLFVCGAKRSGEIYTTEDVRVLEIISKQAATSIENAKLYDKLHQQMQELKQTQDQLIQSTKLAAIGELVANIAHEINNPLTNILGYISLVLEATEESDSRRQDLKVIEQETLRTRSIVRNLLDFARQNEPRKEQVDINQVIGDTLMLVYNMAEVANVRIVSNLGEKLPSILMDINQSKQVFINLMNNAIQAMPKGGVLTIKTFAEQSHVVVQFSDTGVGIPQKNLYKLFDPFFTTKPAVKGTGLGLSISYGIIKKHGGTIQVESEEGKGSTFTVRLPLKFEERIAA